VAALAALEDTDIWSGRAPSSSLNGPGSEPPRRARSALAALAANFLLVKVGDRATPLRAALARAGILVRTERPWDSRPSADRHRDARADDACSRLDRALAA